MEKQVVEIPGSLSNFLEVLPRFTEAGLTGLANHWQVANEIGELLASRRISIDDLYRVLLQLVPKVGSATLESDPQAFWTDVYREIFGRVIVVPPVPKRKFRVFAAFEKYQLMLVFIPAVSEADFPTCFVKPNWGRFIDEVSKFQKVSKIEIVSKLERRKLPGRWVFVDTAPKPSADDKSGYQDRLTKDLDLVTRFGVSWNNCENILLSKFAKLMGLSRKAVRLTTAEEWNFIANLFNWLRSNRSVNLPDLGSTRSFEWCDNGFDAGCRLYVGNVANGGLACILFSRATYVHIAVGCRFLAVL